jgi:hypothetical protein
MQTSSPQLAAQVLLERRRIRSDLLSWCRRCGFKPAKHHRLLISKLEQVARGEVKRPAFFLPPGAAKSTYGSISFPAYVLAQDPRKSLLAASHTVELAAKWGRRSGL